MPYIPPSLLNFVAGLAAGAGINLLTSLSGSAVASRSPTVRDSIVWLVAAGFLSGAAQAVESAERAAALAIDNTLTKEEQRAILRDEMSRVRVRYSGTLILSLCCLVAAIAFVPALGV